MKLERSQRVFCEAITLFEVSPSLFYHRRCIRHKINDPVRISGLRSLFLSVLLSVCECLSP